MDKNVSKEECRARIDSLARAIAQLLAHVSISKDRLTLLSSVNLTKEAESAIYELRREFIRLHNLKDTR